MPRALDTLDRELVPDIQKNFLKDTLGYVENAGTPVSAVVPAFIGQWCYDTSNDDWYLATGTTDADWALLGISGVTAAQLAFLAVTAGTGLASKAAVLDANGNFIMPANGIFGLSREALAAAGSTSADAAVITDQVVAVTGADGTKGVALPAAAVATGPFLVINTDASNGLKVYPVDGGNDQINSEAEDAAVTLGPGRFGLFVPTSATQWYVAASALITATPAEINAVDVTAGVATASKALVLDANSKIDGLPLVKRSLTALTLVNLQALAATPIEVVAAPGAGKFIQVLAWRFRLIFGATAIDDAAADGDLILKYAGGSTIDTMQADGLVDATAHTQGVSGNLTELIAAESALDNKAVQISNDGDEFTIVGGGDGTAEVEVFYRILDTNPA